MFPEPTPWPHMKGGGAWTCTAVTPRPTLLPSSLPLFLALLANHAHSQSPHILELPPENPSSSSTSSGPELLSGCPDSGNSLYLFQKFS